jgi:hypothetical protein
MSGRLFKTMSGVVALSAVAALSGPNAGAGVVVDHVVSSEAIEAVAPAGAVGDELVVAVVVSNAVDLDGFAVTLKYDAAALRVKKVVESTDATPNFLKSAGGDLGPAVVKADKAGIVDVAGSIVGKDRSKAPEGTGVVALVVFERVKADETAVSVAAATLIDPDLVTDAVVK